MEVTTNNHLQKVANFFAIASFLCFLPQFAANAGEFTARAGISSSYVYQEIDAEEQDDVLTSDNLIINPTIGARYQARRLNVDGRLNHFHVRRSLEDESLTNNYLNYNIAGRFEAIENALFINASTSQAFRGATLNTFLVDDFLLNADNLIQTQTSNASAVLNLPIDDLLNINLQTNYSKIKTSADNEEDVGQLFLINNESYGGNLSLSNGQDFNLFGFTLNASFNELKRSDRATFRSEVYNGELLFPILRNLQFTVSGNFEDSVFSNEIQTGQNVPRRFYRYGAGLRWSRSVRQFIQVEINQSTTDDPFSDEGDENTFLSTRINWDFSTRTSLQADVTRRFFGDAATVAFSHNTRNLRNRLTYSETVTANSRLFESTEEGLFLCDIGSVGLDSCTLPDTIDVGDVPPGQILVPFVQTDFEINDDIILRKRGALNTVLSLRRTNLSMTIGRTNTDRVEAAIFTKINFINLRSSLRFSSRTSLTASFNYTDLTQENDNADTVDELVQSSIIRVFDISLERRFRSRLFASIGFRYLDRSGDILGEGGVGGNIPGITGPLSDSRITASIRYQFANNRR